MRSVYFWLMLVTIAIPVQAEIYKWVDADGKIHYSDSKPAHLKSEQINPTINSYKRQAVPDAAYGQDENFKLLLPKSVVMYATSWCGYCKKARRYFAENNIEYTEYDIETSMPAKRDYDRLGGRGVPLLRIGDATMRGWNPSRFEEIYRE